MSLNFYPLVNQVNQLCLKRHIKIALAESCTGGTVSGLITEIPGCSQWFCGSAVVYSNEAKTALLNVDPVLIKQYGAVSEPVAKAMAEGARTILLADIAVSITGIAGPGGGTTEKPVGTVCFAVSTVDHCESKTMHFASGRAYVQRCATEVVLGWLIDVLRSG